MSILLKQWNAGMSSAKNWSSYWATLISASVENAAPTHVVLTFPTAQTSLGASGLSATIDGETSVISSASWTGAVLTVVLADTVVYGDTVVITLLATGGTTNVTNNTLADYYVRADGSNTAPYDTPAKGATNVNTVMTYIGDNGTGLGQVVSIGEGTFASNISLNKATHNNLKITGEGGLTILAHESNNIVFSNTPYSGGAKIKKLTLMPAVNKAMAYCIAGGDVSFYEVGFLSRMGHIETCVKVTDSNIKFRRCWFKTESGDTLTNIIYATGSGGIDLDYCYSIPTTTGKVAGGAFVLYQTGISNVKNCVLLGAPRNGVVGANGVVTVYNSIVQAALEDNLSYPINRLSGTLNTYNNLLISSALAVDNYLSVDIDSGNIKTSLDPGFINYGRRGYILLRCDDTGALTSGYINDLSALFESKDVYGTWFTNVFNLSDYDGVRTLLAAGRVEVGLHGYTHTDLTATDALDVAYVGGGVNPTCAFDGSTITLTTDGDIDIVTIDVTSANFNTLGEIVGKHGQWTIAKNADKDIDDGCLASSLKTQAATPVPCTIKFDRVNILSGLLKNEVADAKAIVEANVHSGGDITDPQTGAKYAMRSYGATSNAGDTITKQAVKDAGFITYGYSVPLPASLVMIDLFAIDPISEGWLDVTEEDIRRRARTYGLQAAIGGYALSLACHSGNPTIEQYGWAIDELQKIPNLTITSFQKMADEIMADWNDEGDGVYSNDFGYPDLHLTGESPCINSGIDVSLDVDIERSSIIGLPDIGCYEYQG